MILVLIGSCKEKAVQPVQTSPAEPKPDTTSHNFTWHIDTLGNFGSSSSFNDVAIINDSLAYAVGEIFFARQHGQDRPNPLQPCRMEWPHVATFAGVLHLSGVARFISTYCNLCIWSK
jgi:hypothetical protein